MIRHLALRIALAWALFGLGASLAACKASLRYDHFSCADGRCPPGQFCHQSDGLCHREPEADVDPASNAGDGGAADGGGASGEAGQSSGETGSSGSAGEAADGGAGQVGAAGETPPDAGRGGGTSGTGGEAGMSAEGGAGGTPPGEMSGTGGMSGTTVLGGSCASGADCASTFCADGVCCQSECTDSCSACNLPDSAGVCTPLAAGEAPSAGHPACSAEPQSSCGKTGKCDGAGRCALWGDVVCKPASCSPGTNSVTSDSKCDGNGGCIGPSPISCAPFTCDAAGNACRMTCSGSEQCAAPNPCVAGSCGPKLNGSVCTTNPDCTSGNCVDGVCCNSSCGGQCEACDVGGSAGTCTAVTSGAPHGSRAACAGSGACAGACGAGSRTACAYPGGGAQCAAASCADASTVVAARFCDGGGGCADGTTTACPTNGCSDGACATCFVAGTLVDTEAGLRPIETIRSGERVRTYDELTGRSSYRKVIERERRVTHGLVLLTFASGATITVSPEHQIWVQDTGWVRAGNLTLDDALLSAEGSPVTLKTLETVAPDSVSVAEGVEVFNLLVEQSPTYYVGADAVLVHSCDYLNFSALDPAEAPL